MPTRKRYSGVGSVTGTARHSFCGRSHPRGNECVHQVDERFGSGRGPSARFRGRLALASDGIAGVTSASAEKTVARPLQALRNPRGDTHSSPEAGVDATSGPVDALTRL